MDTFSDERLSAAGIKHPLLSVIITNYNYAQYVIETLESVIKQTYTHWECIVVDDVSMDDSVGRIKEFIDNAPPMEKAKFTLICRKTNGGQMEAFSDGLSKAQGNFCMMLDSDDVLLPDFMETHIKAHLGKRSVAFTSSNQYQIDGQGNVIAGDHPDHMSKGKYRYIPDTPLHRGYWIWATASSMVFRMDTLRLIMPDPGITFRICADYYIAHFANQLGNSLLIPSFHGCYRRHGENNFGSNPIVGAINSVGCLDQHPPHDEFRWTMINHIIKHYNKFYRIYMEKGIVKILCRLATLRELLKLTEENQEFFTRSKWWYIWQYICFHTPRWYKSRQKWQKRLITVPEEYFFNGKGENPFP
ncbi:MAG: glycosyltransferase [Desulfamplus sp.]|nr:glycosyltransferase [Desulfamplus sp.]